MYVDGQTLITLGAILSAIIFIGGVLFKVYKWYLKQQAQDADIQQLKQENKLIVEGLHACLDGLEQLGANSIVTKTKNTLMAHINSQAHE